jgi:hypothetical protein
MMPPCIATASNNNKETIELSQGKLIGYFHVSTTPTHTFMLVPCQSHIIIYYNACATSAHTAMLTSRGQQ